MWRVAFWPRAKRAPVGCALTMVLVGFYPDHGGHDTGPYHPKSTASMDVVLTQIGNASQAGLYGAFS